MCSVRKMILRFQHLFQSDIAPCHCDLLFGPPGGIICTTKKFKNGHGEGTEWKATLLVYLNGGGLHEAKVYN